MMRTPLTLIAALLAIFAFNETASASTCLIFVHGKRTENLTSNWSKTRGYWNDGHDFVNRATRSGDSSYVIGYDGAAPYHSSGAAGHVSNQIMNAVNGGSDLGGNSCGGASNFVVVAHSMGNTVMDFILGNSDSSDANYNMNGPYSGVAANISYVISVAGAHRGSQLADAACGEHSSWSCDFLGWMATELNIDDCGDTATNWLRSADSAQVKTYSTSPAAPIYLTGGYEAIFGVSACLSGEDDGVVQFPSMFACSGSATVSQSRSQTCGNGSKQESSGFYNIDNSHEDHDEVRNDGDSDYRRAVPDGIWTCGGSPCSVDSVIDYSMTAAELVSVLY